MPREPFDHRRFVGVDTCRGVFPSTAGRAIRGSRRGLFSLLAFGSLAIGLSVAGPAAGREILFNRDIRPILAEKCLACHGFDAAKREAGLRLDESAAAAAQLDSGTRAIVPGDPATSALVARIRATDPDAVMPPPHTGKRLSPAEIAVVEEWIRQGAAYQKHWAFEPPRPATIPPAAVLPGGRTAVLPGKGTAVETSIDAFVQARLAAAGFTPATEASPTTLIRRASLDLVGLPPEPQEIDAFLAAWQADPEAAYRALVERLLASPHHGERWGRWWLDQARYADSNGYSIDAPRQIWKYRDWVIDAINADMPFDTFTIHQLAGDLVPDAGIPGKVATGFHRNTPINQEGGIDVEQFRVDSVFDRVATTGAVWLGLTIGCAQCHDHKFDPISQRDYYRLFAFMNNQEEPKLTVVAPTVNADELVRERADVSKSIDARIAENAPGLDAWEDALDDAARKPLAADVTKALAVPRENRTPLQRRTLYGAGPGAGDTVFQSALGRFREVEASLAGETSTLVLKEIATPRTTTVFIQGDFTRPAEEVTPGTPGVLHPLAVSDRRPDRLDLARWLVDPANPLTARVIVNRVWQQYFGRGLVETDNDFGLQGANPTHPELLDWLATEFVRSGWSMKALHRTIVTSHTYRQGSARRPGLDEVDPDNLLLGRQRRLRLDAEIVRDTALAASGLLSRRLGGPPVFPPIPAGVMSQGQVKREWTESKGEDRHRRGLYTFVYRATPPPALNVFDAPDGVSSCTRRIRSNTPLQALTLLNDSAMVECAAALSGIIARDGLAAAFRRCTARDPESDELAVLGSLDGLAAARVLLNLDETITRE